MDWMPVSHSGLWIGCPSVILTYGLDARSSISHFGVEVGCPLHNPESFEKREGTQPKMVALNYSVLNSPFGYFPAKGSLLIYQL